MLAVEYFFNKKTEQKLLGRINLRSNVKGQTQRPNLSSKIKVVTKSNGVIVKDDYSGSRVCSLVKGDFYVFFSLIMYP